MAATPPDDASGTAPTPSDDRPTVRLPPRGDRLDGRIATQETVRLPTQRPAGRGAGAAPRAAARRAPLALAATVTTGWAALVSFTPMLLVVGLAALIDSAEAPTGRVVRVGLATWLLAHGVPLKTGLGLIGLVPLGLTVLAAWRVIRAGVHTARAIGARRSRGPWPAIRVAFAVGAVYGGLGAAAAVAARIPGIAVSVPRAAITLGLFGAACAAVGALAEARVLTRLITRLPAAVRDGVRAGAVAALLVLGAGAALAGTAVALAGGEASQMMADYHTGVAGQAGLMLICLLYAPNVATWAASYLVGPGFLLGAETTVSAARVTLGPLPALPVLAGLPSGPAPLAGSLLLGVPLLAGMTAGWLLVRRRHRQTPPPTAVPWVGLLAGAALAGPVAGALLGLVSLAASGPLGGGRLAEVGPRALPVALTAAAVVALGALTATAASKVLIGVRRRQP